ncbi:nuclease [Iodobacter sp. BJB302]|nr:nuclease [Iodobacter sp. BJB302]
MSSHQIHVFISHSWAYSNHYSTLADWIFEKSWSVGQASLSFRDFSVPRESPIHNAPTDSLLQQAIYKQIALSHVVVIPTGMYTHYSKWIKKEIEGAKYYGKPILAVNPWGQERGAGIVKANADDIVGWNSEPIVKGIWTLHRR